MTIHTSSLPKQDKIVAPSPFQCLGAARLLTFQTTPRGHVAERPPARSAIRPGPIWRDDLRVDPSLSRLQFAAGRRFATRKALSDPLGADLRNPIRKKMTNILKNDCHHRGGVKGQGTNTQYEKNTNTPFLCCRTALIGGQPIPPRGHSP